MQGLEGVYAGTAEDTQASQRDKRASLAVKKQREAMREAESKQREAQWKAELERREAEWKQREAEWTQREAEWKQRAAKSAQREADLHLRIRNAKLDRLLEVPDELLINVLARLDAKSLGRAVSSCRTLARLEKAHPTLWERRCKDLTAFRHHAVGCKKDNTLATLGMDSWKQLFHLHYAPYIQPPSIAALNDRFQFVGRAVLVDRSGVEVDTDVRHLTVQLRLVYGDDGVDFVGDCVPHVAWHDDADGRLQDLTIYVREKASSKMALLMQAGDFATSDERARLSGHLGRPHKDSATTFYSWEPAAWEPVCRHLDSIHTARVEFSYSKYSKVFPGWDKIAISFDDFDDFDGYEDHTCTVRMLNDVLSSPLMHWVPCAQPAVAAEAQSS